MIAAQRTHLMDGVAYEVHAPAINCSKLVSVAVLKPKQAQCMMVILQAHDLAVHMSNPLLVGLKQQREKELWRGGGGVGEGKGSCGASMLSEQTRFGMWIHSSAGS